jgi:lipooligosaccharide transport system ATP-binding protein
MAGGSPPSGGLLRVLGRDPGTDGARIRARLGVVPQEDGLDTELTVAENLFVYGRYFDIPRRELRGRVDELLSFMELTERAGAQVDTLSGGMKRRLTIARALVNEPELVLLDEPTTGLDPQARHLVWERLYRLRQRGGHGHSTSVRPVSRRKTSSSDDRRTSSDSGTRPRSLTSPTVVSPSAV